MTMPAYTVQQQLDVRPFTHAPEGGSPRVPGSQIGGHALVQGNGLDLLELARARKLYTANTGTGTAIAPVVAMPTTAAAHALYNNAKDDTHLVVLKVGIWLVSGTPGFGLGLLAAMDTEPQAAALTKYTNSHISGVTPGSPASKGVYDATVTLTGGAWDLLASKDQTEDVAVGSGLVANVAGMFVVPPGHVLALSALSLAGTTPLFGASYLWAELPLKLQ